MKVLVTGSSGLIGSEAVEYYDREGHQVVGVDNNMWADFFGSQGDTSWNLNRLKDITKNFEFYSIDIRDRQRVFELFETNPLDLIIHARLSHPTLGLSCMASFPT
jgi:CDP-paratose 2-epimerase